MNVLSKSYPILIDRRNRNLPRRLLRRGRLGLRREAMHLLFEVCVYPCCVSCFFESLLTMIERNSSFLLDATLCQTVILQNLATKEVHVFKVRVCNTAAVIIQSKWRCWVTRQHYRHCIQCIISLQCAVGRFCACKLLL